MTTEELIMHSMGAKDGSAVDAQRSSAAADVVNAALTPLLPIWPAHAAAQPAAAAAVAAALTP
jgi:hypothetical protein